MYLALFKTIMIISKPFLQYADFFSDIGFLTSIAEKGNIILPFTYFTKLSDIEIEICVVPNFNYTIQPEISSILLKNVFVGFCDP